MSSLGSPNPFFIAEKKAYEIERSLRFNDGDSAYLNRTFGSGGNRKTYTISAWVKLAAQELNPRHIFSRFTGTNDAGTLSLYVNSDDHIYFTGWSTVHLKSSRKYRDPTAWSHILLAVDTTESASSDRIKLYFNGELQANSTYNAPSQDADTAINEASAEHRIGNINGSGNYFDGYMAEINFIDGFQYDPSYFGKTDPVTGQWIPKKYTGSYGTTGFYLNFSDNSGTTATTLGKDSSGNGNNFTPNNFSVSAGEGNDSLEDTPTNNFPTINPLDGGTNALLTNGNLTFKPNSSNSGNFNVFYSNFSMRSGKWYFEVLIVNENSGSNSIQFGIGSYKYKRDSTNQNGNATGLTLINTNNTNSAYRKGVVDGSTVGSSVSTSSTNDVYGVAFDADNKKVYFYKNGSAEGESSGYNVTDVGTGDFFFFSTLRYSTGGSYGGGDPTLAVNFGQRAFSYTAPTGYKKLNSANLPDPTILLPNKHFDTLLYTGTNTSSLNNVTGLEFQPDWVWGKARNDTIGHILFDAVRGEDRQLEANLTDAEVLRSSAAYRFLSNGFAVSTVGNLNNPVNYVAWNWNAGDTDGKTYTVKVVSDSGNKYRFDDFGTSAVTLDLAEGGTYIFDQSDSSNAGHPLRFSTTADGTHGGGSEYTTGVTTAGTPGQSGAYTQIVVAASAPNLAYYCSVHSGMGGSVNTNSTLGSSNFDGSIQSKVKVNATAGFSIVSYTGTGSNATVGHGLGVAPQTFIVKKRNDSGTNWRVYHHRLNGGSSPENYGLVLNSTFAELDRDDFNDTAPTSTNFAVGTHTSTNNSGHTYIAYCFSEVAGYSKFGSYTGNGNADGTFVFTGFRPAWILMKRTDTTGAWKIFDNKRPNPFNVIDARIEADSSGAESTNSVYSIDLLSNGFKLRGTSGEQNGNGNTFIYLAFSESPFKNARAR